MSAPRLECVSCGYSLRGLDAGARCPECGASTGDMLALLRRDEPLSSALRLLARSYAPVFGVVLIGLTDAIWPLILLGVAMRATAGVRLWRRARLADVRRVRPLLSVLLALAALEAAIPLTLAGLGAATAVVAYAWVVLALASADVASALSATVADLVGEGRPDRQRRRQRLATGVAAASVLLLAGTLSFLTLAGAFMMHVTVVIVAGVIGLGYGMAAIGGAENVKKSKRQEVKIKTAHPVAVSGPTHHILF